MGAARTGHLGTSIYIVTDGLSKVEAMIDSWAGVNLVKRLTKATKAYGLAIKPFIKAEAPVGTPSVTAQRLGATAGELKRSVSVRKSKKYTAGSIVYAKPSRTMFYGHFVQGGTKRGIKPNPFVTRAGEAHAEVGMAAAHKALQENP